jgi:hypothetical protein
MAPALRTKYKKKLMNNFLVLFYLFGSCQGQVIVKFFFCINN